MVSILIPCFNTSEWIAYAIRSALEQTVGEVEVIVGDDGSTDNSIEVIRSFGDAVKLSASSHAGGNTVRNRLLRMATHDWVQFLDADDYLKPNKIATQLAVADSNPGTDVVYAPVMREFWKNGAIQRQATRPVLENASLHEQWVRWQVAQTGTMLWRRESLLRIGGWNEAYPCCQDNELTLRAIRAGLRFCYCSAPDAVYRLWSEQTVCRRDPLQVVEVRTKLVDTMLTWLRSQDAITPGIATAAGQGYFEMSRMIAVRDIPRATTYRRQRIEFGYFLPTGPAAPRMYRIAYRLLGFAFAERIAAMRRR